jgi:Trk K+ transport system NAD-binding subunit
VTTSWLGAVGLRVAERVLAAGMPVVAVQLTEDPLLLSARRQGISIVIGDARFPSTLREAQVHRARAVILVTRDDLTNLEAGLLVRREFPDVRVVLRMYDEQLASQARGLIPGAAVLSTAALAGPAFAAAALGPQVRGTVEHAGQLYVVTEVLVQPGTPADGGTVEVLEAGGRIRVLGLDRRGMVRWRPPAGSRVAAGDAVIAVAAPGGLDDLLRLVRAGQPDLDEIGADLALLPVEVGERPTGAEPWIEERDLD